MISVAATLKIDLLYYWLLVWRSEDGGGVWTNAGPAIVLWYPAEFGVLCG